MRTVTTGEFEGGSVFIDGDWRPLSEGKISLFDWGFTRSAATYDVASVWRGALRADCKTPTGRCTRSRYRDVVAY